MRWMLALILIAPATQEGWTPLFNGKNLDGWDVYVGPPGKGLPPRGLNNDPDGVFTAGEIDGAPAMHVTGQTIGAFTTKEEYDNFHFRVEFKWGEKTWPPRKGLPKDCGILYYCVGPHGAGSGGWMKSVESNVMEEDYGSFWAVAGTIVDIEIGDERSAYREDPKHDYPVYKKGGKLMQKGPAGGDGVRPTPIPEPKPGSWNVAEVISVNGTGIHVFNGQVTLVLRNARHVVDGKLVALTKGKIQMQSEFGEVWYRKPEIRAIREFPAEYREWASGPGGDDGFTPLLDEGHLKDWVQCGPGKFEVNDGVATGFGGMGLWWYKARTFKNFVLRGEYLQETGGNSDSGVFVRFPDPGDKPMVAVKQGHEFEIGDNATASKHGTGSIYPFQGPTWLPVRPPGEWNSWELTCVGKTYDLRLNGHLVNRFIDDQNRPLEGYVGLQNYPYDKAPYDKPVRHRNVRIKELP